jgi:predicted kinase
MIKNNLKVLQGLPGSGKTAYIHAQTLSEVWPRYAMICGDSQYTADVIEASLPHLVSLDAQALCFRRVVNLVIHKAPFIVIDNCNLKVQDIAPYALLAKAYDYNFEIHCITKVVESADEQLKDLLASFKCPIEWVRQLI